MHGQIFDLVGSLGVMDEADEALCLFVLAGSLKNSSSSPLKWFELTIGVNSDIS